MNSGLRIAGALGAGYLLGRTHRTKLALALVMAAASGRLGSSSDKLLEKGQEFLVAVPALGEVSEQSTRLLQAGRAAAMVALTNRLNAVTDRLQSVGTETVEKVGELESSAKGATSKLTRKRKDDSSTESEAEDAGDEEDEFEEPTAEEDEDEDEESDEPMAEEDEYEDEDEDEDEESDEPTDEEGEYEDEESDESTDEEEEKARPRHPAQSRSKATTGTRAKKSTSSSEGNRRSSRSRVGASSGSPVRRRGK